MAVISTITGDKLDQILDEVRNPLPDHIGYTVLEVRRCEGCAYLRNYEANLTRHYCCVHPVAVETMGDVHYGTGRAAITGATTKTGAITPEWCPAGEAQIRNLERVPIGICCQPYLFSAITEMASGNLKVYPHSHQKEPVIFFYEANLLRKHLDAETG